MEKEKENKGAKHKNKAVKNSYSEKLRKASRLPKGSAPDMKDKGGGAGGGTREGGGFVRKGGGGGVWGANVTGVRVRVCVCVFVVGGGMG